jgi:hypothetical protein
MPRILTVQNLIEKKHETFPVNGIWANVLGEPTTSGIWLVYGPEKNGKTLLALIMAGYFSDFARFLYVSAEEGTDKAFTDALLRANLNYNKKGLGFLSYTPIDELRTILKRRNAPKIVLMDNLTIYEDELKRGALKRFIDDFPNVLFIMLAHEERGEPYTAVAKQARRLAKIIYQVKGMACTVSGRCPGGRLIMNEDSAALYHGQLQTA